MRKLGLWRTISVMCALVAIALVGASRTSEAGKATDTSSSTPPVTAPAPSGSNEPRPEPERPEVTLTEDEVKVSIAAISEDAELTNRLEAQGASISATNVVAWLTEDGSEIGAVVEATLSSAIAIEPPSRSVTWTPDELASDTGYGVIASPVHIARVGALFVFVDFRDYARVVGYHPMETMTDHPIYTDPPGYVPPPTPGD